MSILIIQFQEVFKKKDGNEDEYRNTLANYFQNAAASLPMPQKLELPKATKKKESTVAKTVSRPESNTEREEEPKNNIFMMLQSEILSLLQS